MGRKVGGAILFIMETLHPVSFVGGQNPEEPIGLFRMKRLWFDDPDIGPAQARIQKLAGVEYAFRHGAGVSLPANRSPR